MKAKVDADWIIGMNIFVDLRSEGTGNKNRDMQLRH
tara:strand:- start:793 stop:900 length:108 start_codon:yes stop_codon:yes gene_type:complete